MIIKRAPLASFYFSEPTGSANYFTTEGKGLQTNGKRVIQVQRLGFWMAKKIWGTSCCGWDVGGADLQVVVERNPAVHWSKIDSAMLIMLTRATIDENLRKGNPDCYLVVRFVATPGHTACAGPQIRFSNMRIPARFVLATECAS